MKGGSRWKLIDYPVHYFEILGDVENVTFVSEGEDLDGVHAFTNRTEDLEQHLIQCSREIHKKGFIWISWYKKSSGLPTEITEDLIRDTALSLGLVDIKVCAVDEHWSALKIVWRVENR